MENTRFEMFEEMIKLHLCDRSAKITGCSICKNSLGSTVLKVTYTVSDEYVKDNDLLHKDRIMIIMLQRVDCDCTQSIISFADNK